MSVNYHNPESCNKCKGLNKFLSPFYDNNFMCETKTKCTECGFEDYWGYGFFESGANMKSNCKTYNYNKPVDTDNANK